MANPNRRGQAGSEVSTGMQGANYTPFSNTHFVLPYGLRLQQKVGMVDITNVVDAGATVVYTANNNYSAGNVVSIYGVNPVAYNLKNATILSATSTTFTITTAATGTYVSGGVAQRTGEIAVTIPASIAFVYAITVGGGGGGGYYGGQGGGGGGVAWGWTIPTSSCVIGAGGVPGIPISQDPGFGKYTRYGNIISGGGGPGGFNGVYSGGNGTLGAGGGGGPATNQFAGAGATNYWGTPGGASGNSTSVQGKVGAGGGGGLAAGASGGAGISGGGAGSGVAVGGSGLVGGGGCSAANSSTPGGAGGNGINIITGAVSTAGSGAIASPAGGGGGGGGIASNGSNGSGGNGGDGGLGGGGGSGANGTGGTGGAGILYLFY
jgi:hypothetical protein